MFKIKHLRNKNFLYFSRDPFISKQKHFLLFCIIIKKKKKKKKTDIGLAVSQWPGRPGFNPRSSHTKDSKNGT